VQNNATMRAMPRAKNDSQTKSRLTQIKRLLWLFSCMLFVLKETCVKQATAKHLLLVPRKGLEPPRCYSLVPETSASTNSATWANLLMGAFALSTVLYFRELRILY
jgi:hypothetical protein